MKAPEICLMEAQHTSSSQPHLIPNSGHTLQPASIQPTFSSFHRISNDAFQPLLDTISSEAQSTGIAVTPRRPRRTFSLEPIVRSTNTNPPQSSTIQRVLNIFSPSMIEQQENNRASDLYSEEHPTAASFLHFPSLAINMRTERTPTLSMLQNTDVEGASTNSMTSDSDSELEPLSRRHPRGFPNEVESLYENWLRGNAVTSVDTDSRINALQNIMNELFSFRHLEPFQNSSQTDLTGHIYTPESSSFYMPASTSMHNNSREVKEETIANSSCCVDCSNSNSTPQIAQDIKYDACHETNPSAFFPSLALKNIYCSCPCYEDLNGSKWNPFRCSCYRRAFAASHAASLFDCVNR
jgi:hypothetical protein